MTSLISHKNCLILLLLLLLLLLNVFPLAVFLTKHQTFVRRTVVVQKRSSLLLLRS